MRYLLIVFLVLIHIKSYSQTSDSLANPIIPTDKRSFLNNIGMYLNMRMAQRNYVLRGGYHDYDGSQFENEYTALGIYAKVHDKININFRNRFNKATNVESLDQLGNSIELANIDISVVPDFKIILGRQDAYFGGYEYSFNAIEVMQYNDIQSNAQAYVTGIGLDYNLSENHNFGFQILNSRTEHWEEKYEEDEEQDIHQPVFPVEFVGRWKGSFFNGKFQTIYSYSYGTESKDMYTHFITLGHKFETGRFKFMYDFDYNYEDLDTKGLATTIINGNDISDEHFVIGVQEGPVAQKVTYLENWIRTEYEVSSKFRALLSLMTSTAYGKDLKTDTSGRDRLRTSYGVIPSVYYRPFDDIDVRFFVTYVGRYFKYSTFAENQLGAVNYNKNEIKFGFIAPLRVL